MIDRDRFAAGMGVLAGCFGRVVDAAVVRAYYDALSPQLTTEEFERAVRVAIASETYWPAPATLIAQVRDRSAAARALADLVDDLRAHGGYRFYPHERFAALPLAVREGVRAIGGLREITMCKADRFPALERKFAEAFARAGGEATAVGLEVRETQARLPDMAPSVAALGRETAERRALRSPAPPAASSTAPFTPSATREVV